MQEGGKSDNENYVTETWREVKLADQENRDAQNPEPKLDSKSRALAWCQIRIPDARQGPTAQPGGPDQTNRGYRRG